MPPLLFCAIVAVVEVELGADDMRQKPIFASFRNERLRIRFHLPMLICREEIMRR